MVVFNSVVCLVNWTEYLAVGDGVLQSVLMFRLITLSSFELLSSNFQQPFDMRIWRTLINNWVKYQRAKPQ